MMRWIAVTLAMAVGMTAPLKAQTAADYAAIPFVEKPALSPDGQWLAGLFGIGGGRQICLINLFGSLKDRQCVGVPDMMDVNRLAWAGNDDVTVSVRSVTDFYGQTFYVTRLFAVNRKSGNFTKIMWDANGQNASDVVWRSKDGSPTILLAAQTAFLKQQTVDRFRTAENGFWPAIYKVDVSTGKAVKVQNGLENVFDWRADAAGNVRMGVEYSDSDRFFHLLYRSEKGEFLHRIEKANGRKREEVSDPEIFIPGGDHAIVIRNREGTEPSALWEVDLATHTDIAKIYTAPAGARISGTTVSGDGKSILGVWLEGAGQGTVWLDPDLAALQSSFDKAVGERRVHILSMSSDRQKLLVKIDRADTPGSLYYYDTAGGVLNRIAYGYDKLADKPLNPVRTLHYKARDGLEIEAILTLPGNLGPKGREGRKLPVIVMPHGGPWAQDMPDFNYQAQFLAGLGYAVIQPNFRGSTGYGEAFERKGDGQMGLAMQDDLNDALKYLTSEGIVDPARACIVGASYGGYAAMWGVARDAGLWRCGISVSGVASLRREVNDMDDYVNSGTYQDHWRSMTPDFGAVSPINAVDRIKAPLLLVHGKMDVTVDHSQSVSMASKLKSAGKTYEFVSLPKADHYFTREADRLALLQAMEAFLKKHNPPD